MSAIKRCSYRFSDARDDSFLIRSFSRTSSSKCSRSCCARLVQRVADLEIQLQLQSIERGLNLVGLSALLVDRCNPLLEVHAGFDGAEDFVTRAEHSLEQLELLREELEHALVGRVLPVQEVDDDDVVLLAVSVAAADALLDPLGVPGKVVVDDERAELKVDAFRACFGGNHDLADARGSNRPAPTACPRSSTR